MFLPQRKVMNEQCLILPKIYHNWKNRNNTLSEQDSIGDELLIALNDLHDHKAPGFDGLPVEFYKTFWDLPGPFRCFLDGPWTLDR